MGFPREDGRFPLTIKTDMGRAVEFIAKAQFWAIAPRKSPHCIRPDSYSDDLTLGSFTPSRYTWAGVQRKGIFFHIKDSVSIIDHDIQAVYLYFFMAKESRLPGAIRASLAYIATVERETHRGLPVGQIARVRKISIGAETPMIPGAPKNPPV